MIHFLIVGITVAIIKAKHSDRKIKNINRSTIWLTKNNVKKGDEK
jgi:hypothetical protein